MLEQIGSKDKVAQFVADVKAKKAHRGLLNIAQYGLCLPAFRVQEGVRLMGFGHRVYKNYAPWQIWGRLKSRTQTVEHQHASTLAKDPRARVMKTLVAEACLAQDVSVGSSVDDS